MFNPGVALVALTAIGGGTDSVAPDYVSDVDFDSSVVSRTQTDSEVRDTVASYGELYDLSWNDAYVWYLDEDNRYYGLLDAAEKFSSIYQGYSFDDGIVTIWVTSPVKSGGIADLLEDYDIEAEVRVVPSDVNLERSAYDFVSRYGSSEYYLAQPSTDGQGLVVYSSSEEAADRGPELLGTVIDGVPIEYVYSE
ncbi:hypothetical protein [Flaviflexus massiliensis]|uniref:hypothetical protein n=1 Tax=Flaviflexus massiliensis TaxID=1522309 RepID=UPI0011C7EDD4|nr:hypothetical protein [Flaviflexus massiliensis]